MALVDAVRQMAAEYGTLYSKGSGANYVGFEQNAKRTGAQRFVDKARQSSLCAPNSIYEAIYSHF